MNCIKCGEKLDNSALFCGKCGAKQLEELIAPQAQLDEASALRLKRGISFLDNWLAFLALGVLTTITMILFAVGSHGFTMGSMTDIMQQFCLVGALAVSALISTRTGGLDISVGAMMALSSMLFAMHASQNNAGIGIFLALVICVALGLLNGLFIMVMRIPAIFVTVASTVLIRGISLWASNGESFPLPIEWSDTNIEASILALLASVGIGIFLLWRTGGIGKKKKSVRGDMKFFWIYGLIAVIGVFTGWASTIQFGSSHAGIGAGSSNEMIVLFIFAAISASAMLKNNWVALVWTLLIAMLWTIHDQAMILLALNPFSMIVSNASWVFILLAVMSIAKRSWKRSIIETIDNKNNVDRISS